jgi:hypothetical protein
MTNSFEKINKRLLTVIMIFAVAVMFGMPVSAFAENVHGIPAYQEKDFFSTNQKSFDIPVTDDSNSGKEAPAEDGISFEILNTTTQQPEGTAVTKDGKLSGLKLTEDHNYTLICKSTEYAMDNNVYIWVHNGELLNIKRTKEMGESGVMQDQGPFNYLTVDSLKLHKLESPLSENDINRVRVSLPVVESGTDTAVNSSVKFTFVSDTETVTAESRNGNVSARLLEDKDYMVQVEDSQYGIVSFPLAVKDKSEYRDKKYPYNHTNCQRVRKLELYKKASGEPMLTNPTLTSESKNTTLRGIDFGDMKLIDRVLSTNVESLKGKDYEVLGIYAVNTHRYEFSRMAAGSFKYTEIIPDNKTVKNVYYLDGQTLHPLAFKQTGNTVDFTMSTVSIYPVVFEFGAGKADQELNKDALNVKVVNQNNKPIKDVALTLKYNGSTSGNVSIGKTNDQGMLTYIPGSDVFDDWYTIEPADTKQYPCDQPVYITFEENDDGILVPSSVGKKADQDYTGEVTLHITAPDPVETDPTPTEPVKETHKTLKLKVVNQFGNPVSGVKLHIHQGSQNVADLLATDASGKTAYTCDENIFTGAEYDLDLVKGQKVSLEKSLTLYVDGDDDDPYISLVNDQDYDGSELKLTVNDPDAVDPAAGQTKDLKFKIVDEKGNPVSGVKLLLKSKMYPGYGDVKISTASDKDGLITYSATSKVTPEDIYTLASADTSKYELTGSAIHAAFDFNDQTNEPYVKSVSGKAYTKDSEPVQVTVKAVKSTTPSGGGSVINVPVNPGTPQISTVKLSGATAVKKVYTYSSKGITPKVLVMDANNDLVDPSLFSISGVTK